MRGKPRTLDEWKLSPEAKKTVKRELAKWVKLLIEQADGREGNVIRANFLKDEFFYFTNCNDILKDDPEYKAHETDNRIIKRKQKVMLQLLLKQIMGEKLGRVLKCSHCGYEGEEMRKTVNGHYRYCPKCKKISLTSYVPTMIDATAYTIHDIRTFDKEAKEILDKGGKNEKS